MPRKSLVSKSVAAPRVWKPLKYYPHQEAAERAYVVDHMQRLFLAWHRRAGKDVFALDFARERMLERVGTYWHLFPFHVQARRAIWKGIDARTGERFIDRAFPETMRSAMHDTEMSLALDNGSTWQMLGSDNYDRMIGSNPCGVIFSEWALCDPAAWEYIRPILIENNGWAMFITTFRGRNHAWRMFQTIKDADTWYADCRTVRDTVNHKGEPVISQDAIQQEIAEGMDPGLVQQEFYCNPDAAISGAIFARQYSRLDATSPIAVPVNNNVIRIAWGVDGDGIAAVAFQHRDIIAVHCFRDSNLLDAAHAVVRRHPRAALIHHVIDADPALFGEVDSVGVAAAPVSHDVHIQRGLAAAVLNTCNPTAVAKERLLDFTMSYVPSERLQETVEITAPALTQALAVMHSAVPLYRLQSRRLDYREYDRGVI